MPILIIMGVSGSGKTVVGQAVAEKLSWPFYDGDNYHPAINIEKMSAGAALNDEDRRPWLEQLRQLIVQLIRDQQSAVIACSALKQVYRATLHVDSAVRFVYLRGDEKLFKQRLEHRRGHFMPTTLLESQFATLEEPYGALVVDAAKPVQELATLISEHVHS